MKVFAISDLHISGDNSKPMNIFGAHWDNHMEKIIDSWEKKVKQEDLVLIPGDISWAMEMEQAIKELWELETLPGKKLIIKGNHDYWWGGIGKLRNALPPSFFALQNDAWVEKEYVIAGTRGWILPGTADYQQEDEKIFNRELLRMKMSLEKGREIAPKGKMIVMIHYPPFNEKQEDSLWTELFQLYDVKQVVYGHLHKQGGKTGFSGVKNGIQYYLASCDMVNFELIQLPPINF
ncbi:MAG: serine/threonine protein phosphatase [Clostridiales bacterium]|nr:serine/threonine protein phosphatase [Clostridiales bacterium]